MLHIHCGRLCFHSPDLRDNWLPLRHVPVTSPFGLATFLFILSNMNHTTFTKDVAILSDLRTFTVSGLVAAAAVGKIIVSGNIVTITSSHRL